MKYIISEDKNELNLKCVDLISKTLVELGQTKSEQEIVILARSLSDDLQQDFNKLMFSDIENAFRQGVRNTDLFALNVKTYYRWIKSHRQLIWDNDDKEPKQVDKRLNYRSRIGTGLKSIGNLKQLKK
tara:strand:- start:799 stop:1182 length:384 start_codon:yes stop_codon:yes gene_type:complete